MVPSSCLCGASRTKVRFITKWQRTIIEPLCPVNMYRALAIWCIKNFVQTVRGVFFKFNYHDNFEIVSLKKNLCRKYIYLELWKPWKKYDCENKAQVIRRPCDSTSGNLNKTSVREKSRGVCIGNSMIFSDIWHKYHDWYFKIVIRNFTSR